MENRLFLLNYVLMCYLQIQLIKSECHIESQQLYCFDKISALPGRIFDYDWNDDVLFDEIMFESINFDEILIAFTENSNWNNDHIKKIIIVNSTTNSLPENVFINFTKLETLDLSNNNITKIEDGTFNGLFRLKELHLNDNKLAQWKRSYSRDLINLEVLSISRNKLKEIEENVFGDLRQLRKLYLNNNELSNVHLFKKSNVDNCERRLLVEILDLSHNDLTVIDLNCMHQLTEVYLNNNKLNYLNNSFVNSNNLVLLDVSDNYLTDISLNAFISNPNLEYVYLHNNRFRNISLQNTRIKKLDISKNTLENFNNLPGSIEYLNLHLNNLNDTNVLKGIQCEHLHFLDISFNNIKLISHEFCSMNNLTFLNASNNLIQFISMGTFINASSLTYLNLSYNSIDDLEIGMFEGLTNLKIFDVSHNKLKSLNEQFFHPLKELNNLYLDNNMLTTVDVQVLTFHLDYLQEISINNNEWNCEILEHMLLTFYQHNVKVNTPSEYRRQNYKGYGCRKQPNNIINDKNTSIKTIDENTIYNHFVNNYLNETKNLMKYFNEIFKNSSYESIKSLNNTEQQFLAKKLNDVKEFELISVITNKGLNTLLIIICVLLFLITVILLVLTSKIFYKTYSKTQYDPSIYIRSDLDMM